MALYMSDEITKEEWQQKKQEVKNSLPYPEGVTGSEIEQYCKDNGYIGD
jgi:dihydroorotase